MIRTFATTAFAGVLVANLAFAQNLPPRLPFTATLSNNVPLAFGMTVAEVAAALGAPLKYIRGKPGDEVFAAPRYFGAGYFDHHDQLFLQFRQGRLTGWKGDWGKNWMWE